MNKFLQVAMLLLIAPLAFAQNTHRISGKVIDDANLPLLGVSIYAADLGKGVITSDSGTFTIKGLPAKQVKLRFSSVGFATKEEVFDLSNGDANNVTVVLKFEGLSLDDIVITGVANSLSKLTSSVSVSTMKSEDER